MPLTLASALHKYYAKFCLFMYLLCITNLILKTSCCRSQLQSAAARKFTANFMWKAKLKIPWKRGRRAGWTSCYAENETEREREKELKRSPLVSLQHLKTLFALPTLQGIPQPSNYALASYIFLKFDLAACRTCASLIKLLHRVFIIYSVIWQVSKCICTSMGWGEGEGKHKHKVGSSQFIVAELQNASAALELNLQMIMIFAEKGNCLRQIDFLLGESKLN